MVSGPGGDGGSGDHPRQGPGRALRWFAAVSPAAVIGLLLAVLALALPALWALAVSAVAVVLGVLGRRRFQADPSTGPGWISLTAIILGGFVFVAQAVLVIAALAAG